MHVPRPRTASAVLDHPRDRLSRFDGTTFHPVAEASVTAPFVHVFVHGWQPGYWLQERLHALADHVDSLPAWDPRLVDGSGRTLSSYYEHLLEALAALGDDHCVLHYSWLDGSATESDLMLAFRSRQATQVNGRRLAMALQDSLPDPQTHLHLIGHSHGSAVAVHAAAALQRPPQQVTLLDAPESKLSRLSGAANLIDVVLPRIGPGREAGQPFVDSYSTVFGRPYHHKPGLADVVDVSLAAGLAPPHGLVDALNWAHLYAIEWYARSVREADKGVGYGWSPLHGADPKVLLSSYQSMRPHRPLSLTRRFDPPRPGHARRTTRRNRAADGDLVVSTHYPTAGQRLPLLPEDGLIEFDIEVEGGDGTEQIQLDLDAVPVFISPANPSVPRSGRYIVLADGHAGDHLLTARLVTEAELGASVSITGITIVSWTGAARGFTMQRAATSTFAGGAVFGGLTALLVRAGLVRLKRAILR